MGAAGVCELDDGRLATGEYALRWHPELWRSALLT
jgi:hypothetical protein